MKKRLKPLTLHSESLRVLDLRGVPMEIIGQSGLSCVPTCGAQPGAKGEMIPQCV